MIFDVYYLKHRGYSREKEKWIYGYHIEDGTKSCIIDINNKEMIHISSTSLLVKADHVEKTSVGLCCLERDIDGRELYSGDVLITTTGKDSPFSEEFYMLVMYERQGFYGVYSEDFFDPEDFKFCRLVGNVYERSELLYLCGDAEDIEDEDN